MGLDSIGEVGEGVAALLPAGLHEGEHPFDEAASGWALRAEGELAPDHGMA